MHFQEPRGSETDSFYGSNPGSHSRKRKSNFIFWLVVGLIILGLVFIGSMALAYKFYATSQKVIDSKAPSSFLESVKSLTSPTHHPLRGESEGRINILLVGLAGKNYPGANLTDSIIVASINPKTYQTALLSIPRDLYVQIPGSNFSTKINALYARSEDFDQSGKTGIDDLKKTVTDLTGLDINYYVAIDFEGFKQIINELGGVKIQVPKDIHDERYPGPNYSYQVFDIQKGLYTLDGETALKYARTRHDEDGDFGRAYRQQQILEAARQKAFSPGMLLDLPAINNILTTLGDHVRTDIGLEDIGAFSELVKKIDPHTTVNFVLDAGKPDSVMAVSHVFLGGVRAFILVPRTGNYGEIHDLAQNIFNLNVLEQKKLALTQEDATVEIVNRSGATSFSTKLAAILQKLGYAAKISVIRSKTNSVESETIVYDRTKTKPFSLEDLSKKLSARISESLPTELVSPCVGADLCFIAGSDLASTANYDEDSAAQLAEGYDKNAADEKTYLDLLKKGSNQKF